ncbi:MAG: hypothetical protein AAF739_07935 [Pseudomonadota bacterium]
MATGYRPNEAREDNYVLAVVAALIVATVAIFFAGATYRGGLKYLVLQLSGNETEASVLFVDVFEPAGSEEGGKRVLSLNTNLMADLFNVSVEYVDQDGRQVANSFLALQAGNQVEPGMDLPIVYSRWRTDLFLPIYQLPGYRTDARIAGFSSAVIAVSIVSIGWTIVLWRRFRRSRRR